MQLFPPSRKIENAIYLFEAHVIYLYLYTYFCLSKISYCKLVVVPVCLYSFDEIQEMFAYLYMTYLDPFLKSLAIDDGCL